MFRCCASDSRSPRRRLATPEEDRWRLLQAATDLLRNASAQQPLLAVFEDLHDADRGTLDLLLYLARNLRDARILVVGTYRDVAVDRAHPLSAALTELHRASNVARIQLHGLSSDEVYRFPTETSQQTVSQPFAELVHVRSAAMIIGTIEVIISAVLASGHWWPRVSLVGSQAASIQFIITFSFLFTTSGLSPDAQGFLMKDLILFGAATWTAADALREQSQRGRHGLCMSNRSPRSQRKWPPPSAACFHNCIRRFGNQPWPTFRRSLHTQARCCC
jgi:hypothetical protein